jgi:hypothetical protein
LQELVGEFRQALRLSHENENYFEKFVAFLKFPTKSPSIWFFSGVEQYSWRFLFFFQLAQSILKALIILNFSNLLQVPLGGFYIH